MKLIPAKNPKFAQSWGYLVLPDLAASPLGGVAEALLERVQPNLKPVGTWHPQMGAIICRSCALFPRDAIE